MEIREAIAQLGVEERASLAADLCGWQDDAWDAQMKQDAAAGRLQSMNDAAVREHAAGYTVPLEEGL